MVAELNSISSAVPPPPQGMGPAAPSPAPAEKAHPKVVAPKPVEINYDEAKSLEKLKQAVSSLNEQLSASKTGLGIQYDDSLNRPVITVRNLESGEVVRQIPNEVVIRISHSIDDLKGWLHNDCV